MGCRLAVVVMFLALCDSAKAQISISAAVVASVFSTIGAFIIALLIYCWLTRNRKKKLLANVRLSGYDNIVVVADEDNKKSTSSNTNESGNHSTVSFNKGIKASLSNLKCFNQGIVVTCRAQHTQFKLVIQKEPKRESARSRDRNQADDQIVTVLLDQKQAPTNGFDVAQNKIGDIVVSGVRKNGPAEGKLKEGDVIESLTVFFDGLTYEDAAVLLSKAAPYTLAVSVSQKPSTPENPEQGSPESGVQRLYPSFSGVKRLSVEKHSAPTTQEHVQTQSPIDGERVVVDSTQASNHSISSSSSSGSEADVTVIQKNPAASVEEKDENGLTELKARPKDQDSSSESSSSEEGSFHVGQDATPLQSTPLEKPDAGDAQSPDARVEDNVVVQSAMLVMQTPILTPSRRKEDIEFISGWRKAVKLLDLIQARLVDEETVRKLEFGEIDTNKVADDLQQYLKGSEPIAGVLLTEDNTKMSLYDATKNDILRRGTAVGLLEAQAATGSIINPYNGERMNVEEATKEGLIDPQLAAVLARAEKAVLGFKSRLSDEPLSLFDAMERKLVMESHGIRLLEAQIATGGIIDPVANHRLPVEVAFERGLFNHRLNKILENPEDDTKGFFDPNTDENLTYLELIDRCVKDEKTGLRLLPIHKSHKKSY